jgi:hypothetical protein
MAEEIQELKASVSGLESLVVKQNEQICTLRDRMRAELDKRGSLPYSYY